MELLELGHEVDRFDVQVVEISVGTLPVAMGRGIFFSLTEVLLSQVVADSRDVVKKAMFYQVIKSLYDNFNGRVGEWSIYVHFSQR